MKNKNKVTKLNEKEYEEYIKSITNGETANVPEIAEIKKD